MTWTLTIDDVHADPDELAARVAREFDPKYADDVRVIVAAVHDLGLVGPVSVTGWRSAQWTDGVMDPDRVTLGVSISGSHLPHMHPSVPVNPALLEQAVAGYPVNPEHPCKELPPHECVEG